MKGLAADGEADVSDREEAEQHLMRKECSRLTRGCSVEETVLIRIAVEQAVASLPERQRRACELWMAECEVKEIAAQMNLTRSTCYKTIERMLVHLRRILRALDHVAEDTACVTASEEGSQNAA